MKEQSSQEQAKMQELRSNYNLLCMKYKKLKKESQEKDNIILKQEKTINELHERLKFNERQLDL